MSPFLRSAVVLAAVVCGVLLAGQAQLNGDLTAATGSALGVTALSFVVGTVILGVLAASRRSLSQLAPARLRSWHWWWFSTGLLGAYLILMISFAVPVVGVALVTVLTVAGQTTMGMLLDARGTGTGRAVPFTPRRLVAVIVTVAGLATAVWAVPVDEAMGWIPIAGLALLLVLAGIASSTQQAANGSITAATGEPVLAAFVAFLGGSLVLIPLTVWSIAVSGFDQASLPAFGDSWLLYCGGVLGAVFVASTAWLVRRTGVLVLSLAVVGGQLGGAVVFDLLAGNVAMTIATFISLAAVALAVILAAPPRQLVDRSA